MGKRGINHKYKLQKCWVLAVFKKIGDIENAST